MYLARDLVNNTVTVTQLTTEGVHNEPSQHVPLWHMDYFELKAIETSRLQRNFCPSLNYLEEFKLEVFPRMKIISRDKFDLSGPSVWQGKHPVMKHLLLFLLLRELPSSRLKPQAPFHSVWHIDTSFYLSVFESVMYVGFLYIQN